MKRSLLVLVLLLGERVAGQNLNWVNQYGDVNYNLGVSTICDNNGNVYATGIFEGTADFDPGPGVYTLSALGAHDVYVTKCDSSGSLLWACCLGGTQEDYVWKMTIDVNGDIYTTGYFKGIVDFDPGPATLFLGASGAQELFVWKLSSAGNVIWARNLGPYAEGREITTDNSGDVYFAGIFGGTVDFDPGPGAALLTANASSPNSDYFVCKFSSGGNFVWVNKYAVGFILGLAFDNTAGICVAGVFSATSDFDPGPGVYNLIGPAQQNPFVTKVDLAGNFMWAVTYGGTVIQLRDMTVDQNGDIYTTGSFFGTPDFDPGSGVYNLTASVPGDGFLSKLDASGNFIYAKQFAVQPSLIHSCMAQAVAADAHNNIYVAGYFGLTVDFDPSPGIATLTSTTAAIFITKLDASGNYQWARKIDGIQFANLYDMRADAFNSIYLTGAFGYTVNFNTAGTPAYELQALNANDAFLLKLSAYCDAKSPLSTTPPANLFICTGNIVGNTTTTLTVNGTGNIRWYSAPASTVVLATGSAYLVPGMTAGTYTYYVSASQCMESARTAIVLTIDWCTGLGSQALPEDPGIYPNPSSGSFFLTAGEEGDFSVYSVTGQKLHEGRLKTGKNNIELPALPPGIYMLERSTVQGSRISRVILQ